MHLRKQTPVIFSQNRLLVYNWQRGSLMMWVENQLHNFSSSSNIIAECH